MKRIAIAAIALIMVPACAQAETPDAAETSEYVEHNRQPISLLPAKGVMLGIGAAVAMDGNDFGIGSNDLRQVSASLSLRYGLTRLTEVFAQAPIGRTRIRASLLGSESSATYTTGQVEVGLRHLITHRSDITPEIVASASLGHPVGNVPGAEPYARAALTAYQVIDPVVLTGEVGTAVGLRTGDVHFDLEGKLDFAINDRISLGMGVAWASAGSDFGDPVNTGVAVTGSVTMSSPSGASSFTPYVSIGASSAAPDVVLGLSWTRRW